MSNPALLIIDVQQGFDDPYWGTRNNPNAELNMVKILEFWREKSFPVIHIQHCSIDEFSPLHPSKVGNQFKPEANPLDDETVFTKSVNSAFIGTNLEAHLREKGISNLVIVGLTTDHCVSTTTRMAGNLGFDVKLISDATATFNRHYNGVEYSADEIHQIHLASLNGEFCQVMTIESLLLKWA